MPTGEYDSLAGTATARFINVASVEPGAARGPLRGTRHTHTTGKQIETQVY